MDVYRPRAVLATLGVAAAYYTAAWLGLQLQFQATQATPVWPPSGIAFAALLLFGPRLAAGVFLGAFLANLTDFYAKSAAATPAGLLAHFAAHPEEIAVAALIGFGNMLEALIGIHIVRRFGAGADITHDIFAVFVFVLAALASCLVASSIGIASLAAAGFLPPSLRGTAWFTWWLRDAAGVLIVAPLAVAWSSLDRAVLAIRPFAKLICVLLLFLYCVLTFGGWLEAGMLAPVLLRTQAYTLIPILLWVEYAFGSALGTLGVALAAAVAVLGTAAGHGPFVAAEQNEALLVLQGFIAIVSIAMLVLDAALRERRQALADLTRARDELEQRVRERTAELRQVNDKLSLQIRERNQAVEALQRETLEHHRTEEALRESQKLEALGQLTGGVAHDFNNLLLIIGSNLFMLRRRLGETGTGEFDAVDRALGRAESLTRHLLTFGRRQALQPRRIDLVEHLPKVAELIRHLLPGSTEVRLDIAADVWPVDIDPNEFELAVINIAVNAKDAMPKGGVLTIAASNEPRGGPRPEDELAGDCVSIAVSDTGTGIPTAVIARVFEPYFTTKEPGKGTGLGLSQVYGFARQSGGTATVASAEGQGTTVTLYLPRARPAVALAAATAVPLSPPAREQAVLVVEDDPEVAEVSVALLETLGYRVTHVTSAQAALDTLSKGGSFDLVFTDVVMPGGMSGVELARALRNRYPGLPVLLTTGYSIAAQEASKEGFPILPKPYRPTALQAQIRDLLPLPRAAEAQAAG
ncbi:MAG TPA: MASE1 domain-containing protein [Stellaceae bacterium]|nr:MASE1 domain-containing protein [Stellaceae bacterium]